MNTPQKKFTVKFLIYCLGVTLMISGGSTARAADFEYDLVPYTGNLGANMHVEVSQAGSGLEFTLTQNNTTYGDIRAFYFQVQNETLAFANSLSFNVISSTKENGAASTVGISGVTFNPNLVGQILGQPDTNLNGGGVANLRQLDFGLAFGGPGGGGNDFVRSIVFNVTSNAFSLDVNNFFPASASPLMAGRIKSLPGNPDSSKLDCCGTTTVPEPEMAGLLALAFGALLWRRRLSA